LRAVGDEVRTALAICQEGVVGFFVSHRFALAKERRREMYVMIVCFSRLGGILATLASCTFMSASISSAV
jgi:hypothetical protein